MYFMHGLGAGWMGFLWLILVGGLVVLIVSNMSRRHQPYPDSPEAAIRILKERYARGEISREEYEEKAKDLRKF